MGGRAADGVRRPGGLPPVAGGAAGPLLRAVTRLLRPAQVDDVRRPLLPAADRRPALTGPRAHSWARGVAPSTFHRHGRLRRSARGFRESAELWSVSRPRHDALCTCANAHDLQLERLGDVGRDKRLTSRCSVQRAAIRRGGDLGLALREPYVRRCRGSGDVKAWRRADSFSVSGRLPYLHLA